MNLRLLILASLAVCVSSQDITLGAIKKIFNCSEETMADWFRDAIETKNSTAIQIKIDSLLWNPDPASGAKATDFLRYRAALHDYVSEVFSPGSVGNRIKTNQYKKKFWKLDKNNDNDFNKTLVQFWEKIPKTINKNAKKTGKILDKMKANSARFLNAPPANWIGQGWFFPKDGSEPYVTQFRVSDDIYQKRVHDYDRAQAILKFRF